jgi:fructoselysine-6-P-deglycase FrlB-like protein
MLGTVEEEVRAQPGALKSLLGSSIRRVPAGSIFTGAGDSYIAAQCACALSSYSCTALDPYELLASPDLAGSRTVVFVSSSGRTRSNVAAAKNVGKIAAETIAVTANRHSPLADVVDEVVLLPYSYKPRLPGTLSFSLSLLSCLKLASGSIHVDFYRAMKGAEAARTKLLFSDKGTTFFLGNGAAYWVSAYAAAKMYEFFGAQARPVYLEQFSHMDLFSLGRGDVVNVYSISDPLELGLRLVSSLKEEGYSASYIHSRGTSQAESVFRSIFLTQLSVAERARSKGQKVPYFLLAKKKLRISDAMIY